MLKSYWRSLFVCAELLITKCVRILKTRNLCGKIANCIVHITIYNWVLNCFKYHTQPHEDAHTYTIQFKINFKHVFTCNERIFSTKMIHLLMICFFFAASSTSKCKYSKESIYHNTFYMNYTHTHTHTIIYLNENRQWIKWKKKWKKNYDITK